MSLLLPYWPTFALCYVLTAQLLSNTAAWRPELTLMRVLVACATSWSVFFSDKFHNSDKLGPKAQGIAAQRAWEAWWLRWDFVGISAVLSSTFGLWSAHVYFQGLLGVLTALSALLTGACAVAAFALFERKGTSMLGELLIKAILGIQFVVLFGYMVHDLLQTSCAPHTVIWFTYLPGFVVYVLKYPKDGNKFGAHDVFHVFIIAGHFVSCTCDIVNVQWDCHKIDNAVLN